MRIPLLTVALLLGAAALPGCLGPASGAEASEPVLREYHLEAKEVDVELYPGKTVRMWTFNGEVPGPVIRATEGDLVRVHFWNNHTLPHTVHFHGEHPYEMDGADDAAIPPGGTFTYEFVARPAGSFVYHCHVDTPVHIPMGLYGQFIVDPREPVDPAPDREFFAVFGDWNPNQNHSAETYLLNGRAFPNTVPFQVDVGDRVRVHITSMSEFPVAAHLHGIGVTQIWPARHFIDVVPLAHAETRVVEFTAGEPGPWMFHDHYEQHLTNDGAYPGGSMGAFEVGRENWGRFHRDMGGHGHAHDESGTGAGDEVGDAPVAAEVAMTDYAYAPAEVTVRVGEAVRWRNDGEVAHTVSADDGSWGSGMVGPEGAYVKRFDAPGTYRYHCAPHSAKGADGAFGGMVGTVVVVA